MDALSSNNNITFPLAKVTQETLAGLCRVLWGWTPCTQWVAGQACQTSNCSCKQAAKLEPFFDFYRLVTAYYLPDEIGHAHPALSSHEDLLEIISFILTNQDTPRSQLSATYFEPRSQQPCASDQNRAFNLAARIITMIQPSDEHVSDGLLEAGIEPVIWGNETSFTAFVQSVFTKREYPVLNSGEQSASSLRLALTSITSHRLKKVAGLEIIPTNDLRQHLALDHVNGTVSLFHYTSVLKEYLCDRHKDESEKPDAEKELTK